MQTNKKEQRTVNQNKNQKMRKIQNKKKKNKRQEKRITRQDRGKTTSPRCTPALQG